jgi:hypothetical protein
LCIETVLNNDSKCPLCRKEITRKEKKRNFTLQNIIATNCPREVVKKEQEQIGWLDELYPHQYISQNLNQNKCMKCNRPIGKEFWRTYCTYCYAKVTGKIVKCSSCPKRLPILRNQFNKKNYCLDCYRKRKGKNGVCSVCNLVFYYMPLSSYSSTICEKCFLAAYGVKIHCVDCRKEIYVMEDQIEWKNKCYDCWVDS